MDHSNTANCSRNIILVSKIYHFYPTTWTPPIWSIILLLDGAVLPRISQAFSTAFWVSRGTSYALESSLVSIWLYEYYLSTKGWVNWSWTKAAHNGKVSFSPSRYMSINSGTSLIPSGALQRLPRHVVNNYRKIPAGWGKERKAFVWNFRPWSTIQISDKWPRSCSTPCGATFREDRIEVY